MTHEQLLHAIQSLNAAQYSPCRPRMPEVRPEQLVRHVTVYDSIIPALQAPPRAQVRPAGSSSGSNEWETQATIETTMPVAELVAHYAAEMRREGWEPVADAAATPTAAVQVWRRTATDGRRWHATLSFAAPPDTRRYHATLRLQREDAQ